MNESIISWTNRTWNPTHGCSKVSDGCKHCYAMTLSLKYGWTKSDWTLQNEDDNVLMKPHKLKEPYTLKEPQRIFVNSMSDLFHRSIPDWYRAIVFAIMNDLDHHVFQILTKRGDQPQYWPERYIAAVNSPEYAEFMDKTRDKRIVQAMQKAKLKPDVWGDNIWMGVSVEDARVIARINDLKKCAAKVRFISAEPLLGYWGDVDLSGIHWVIVGGESGLHLSSDKRRWMSQDWAQQIKDLCVNQGVAFFYKQDSGLRTEQRTFLIEPDGSRWKWEQYPNDMRPPVNIDTPMQGLSAWDYERMAYQSAGFYVDNYALTAAYLYQNLA